ncbi:hypothetical protein Pyn_19976 [Prunus yedoensis var. nudiflora]|uniref:Non-haem dioxygenase N-terminal domain-containing protein n=1 Tax=Prunus yedoensis var. nudiflora TaxID=2094558 RepID=A0A314Z877_PRUYE|nr:hypothetical protein Pyn_19976 [Prunus yedoensis var. nudiflora]
MAPAFVDYTTAEKELYEFDDLKIGVKGLVDARVTHIPRFFIHPPECRANNSSTQQNNGYDGVEIPVIDLKGFNENDDRRVKIVNAISDACATWGFFQIVNHGVPLAIMEDMTESIRASPPIRPSLAGAQNRAKGSPVKPNRPPVRSLKPGQVQSSTDVDRAILHRRRRRDPPSRMPFHTSVRNRRPSENSISEILLTMCFSDKLLSSPIELDKAHYMRYKETETSHLSNHVSCHNNNQLSHNKMRERILRLLHRGRTLVAIYTRFMFDVDLTDPDLHEQHLPLKRCLVLEGL